MVPVTIFGYTPAQLRKTTVSVAGYLIAVATYVLGSGMDLPQWVTATATGVVGLGTVTANFLTRNAPLAPPAVDHSTDPISPVRPHAAPE